MQILTQAIPSLSVALLSLLAMLPWGLPSNSRFVLPLLPYIAIHYWTARDPERLPAWVVFACGLAVDVLTNGPLGYWSLIYLAGYVFATGAGEVRSTGPGARWLLFLSSLAMLVVCAWALSSLYFFDLVEWTPFAWAAVAAGIAYPVIAYILRALDPRSARRLNDRLERGV
jgi:rod shape-determining protein MreD